jgi:Zn-dependent protease/CBS domain-containing protein
MGLPPPIKPFTGFLSSFKPENLQIMCIFREIVFYVLKPILIMGETMRQSLKIFTVFGIPIELHISFLFLMLIIYIIAFLNIIPGLNVLMAVLITLLFVTVVIHELGHSYVAQRYGVNIKSIVLLPIGGVSSMEEIPSDPGQEFRIAVAGPAVNFAIAAAGYAVVFALGSFMPKDVSSTIYYFSLLNLVLGAFNLLPAFPMDGGRVLRAYLAGKMSYVRATELAATVGKQLAIVMAIVGIFFNIFLILIGIFIYMGAEQEYRSILISTLLEGVLVQDIMTRKVKTLKPTDSIGETLDLMFQEKHMGYPVTDGKEILGIVTFHDISRIPENMKDSSVDSVMTKNLVLTRPGEQVFEALKKLNKHGIGRLPVVDNDELVGIISKTDVTRSLEILNLKLS